MPIYEYTCRSCGHDTEIMHRMSDPPVTDCPACGAAALTKLVSAAGFRLSGGGWYETDFKKDAKKNLAGDAKAEPKADAEAQPKADAKAEPKADAKVAPKPDARAEVKAAPAKPGPAAAAGA